MLPAMISQGREMAGVAITRTDLSAADLRAAAKRSANAKQASRILAIAMVLDGFSREEAARLCGMDRQTLRDWVHRYNKEGLDGLARRARSGRPASFGLSGSCDDGARYACTASANHRPRRWRQIHHPTPATYPCCTLPISHQRHARADRHEAVSKRHFRNAIGCSATSHVKTGLSPGESAR